jgi:hypothetical protein
MSQEDFWRVVAIIGLIGFGLEYAMLSVMLSIAKSQNKVAADQLALIRELMGDE